jgi:hypothetical protein
VSGEPEYCTEGNVPPDTAEYVFRPVTRMINNDAGGGVPVIETVYTQIWISQP